MRLRLYAWTSLVLSAAASAAVARVSSSSASEDVRPTSTSGHASSGTPPRVTVSATASPGRNGGNCEESYTTKDTTLTFDGLRQYCFRVCSDFVTQSLTYPRGTGWADYLETTEPVLYPNDAAWSVLNCSALPRLPEGQACGIDPPPYAKALLSNGSSQYDSNKPPRLGSLEFAEDVLLFDLKSLYVTPIVMDITVYTYVKVHIKGLAKDGRVATHTATLLANKRGQITVGNDFKKLSALDIWIEKPGSTKKYPFAVDDISITEYVPNPKPWYCSYTTVFPAGEKGPCKPKPTATTTWTIGFDGVPAETQIPDGFGGVTWGNEYSRVANSSTDPLSSPEDPVGPPSPPSQRNYLVNSGNNVVVMASTFDEIFGLKEVSVLCRFPPFQEGDPNQQNGRPCIVTFVGRRDKYDGSGLPVQVKASVSIPNPNITDGRPRPFTKVNLDSLTNQPGGFSRLYRLEIFTEIGDQGWFAQAAFDNFVFTREMGEGTKCRVRGVKTVNFDNLKASSPVPSLYKGFKFIPQQWDGVDKIVGSNSAYPDDAPKTSRPNALRANTSEWEHSIDSYVEVNPADVDLFDFESITVTTNLSRIADADRVNALRLSFNVIDACGADSYRFNTGANQTSMFAYYESVQPMREPQIKFARPFIGMSRINLNVYYDYDSLYSGEKVQWWIDDFKYRPNNSPIPPCRRCGYRGAGLCEFGSGLVPR